MSGTVQLVFSSHELEEEKDETVFAAEEFRVSEYREAVSLQRSTFSSSSPSNNWNNLKSCLKSEEYPGTEDSESVPIYAASLLDPSFLEQKGILNEVKIGGDSSSFFPDHFLEERQNSIAALETPLKAQ